jgi:hypothetical protein
MLKTEKKKLLYCSQHKNSPEGKKMAHPTREIFLLCSILKPNQMVSRAHGPLTHSTPRAPGRILGLVWKFTPLAVHISRENKNYCILFTARKPVRKPVRPRAHAHAQAHPF